MEELKFQSAAEDGLDIEDVLLETLDTYQGLIVAVTTKRNFDDFVLC